MDGTESVRARYRPETITTLFVGESAPFAGTFFYYGNGQIWRNLQTTVDTVFGRDGDFLDRFKSFGWYLDDLVLTPVNYLSLQQRKIMRLNARNNFVSRLVEYRPEAIVCLMKGIGDIVSEATMAAGCRRSAFSVPYPGNGQQRRFHEQMAAILPLLPRH
jgi:hypothetical protein